MHKYNSYMEHQYDIFISYRRKDRFDRTTGTAYARNIQQTLEANGYKGRVFFDHNNMEPEDFEKIILSAIRCAKVFILILTKDSMLRCANKEDWVRREILEAKQHNLKILIINMENEFKDSDYPEDFPEELYDPVKKVHHLTLYSGDSYEREMKHIIDKYISPIIPPLQTHRNKKSTDNIETETLDMHDNQKEGSFLKRLWKSLSTMFIDDDCILPYKDVDCYYKVGDYYEDSEKEGIVISVTDNGLHGIIVSLDEYETQWCDNGEAKRTRGVSARATSENDGALNTSNITKILDWESHYLAFKSVGNAGGNMIWFVPSIKELSLLKDKATLDAVNSGLASRRAKLIFTSNHETKSYWSSTETPDKDTVYTLFFTEYGICDKESYYYKDRNWGICQECILKDGFAFVRPFARF